MIKWLLKLRDSIADFIVAVILALLLPADTNGGPDIDWLLHREDYD